MKDGVGDIHVAEVRLLVGNDTVFVANGACHGGQGIFAGPVDFLHETAELLDFSRKRIRGESERKAKLCATPLDDGTVHAMVEVLGNEAEVGRDNNHQELPVVFCAQVRWSLEFRGRIQKFCHLRPAAFHRLERGVDENVRHLFVGEFLL